MYEYTHMHICKNIHTCIAYMYEYTLMHICMNIHTCMNTLQTRQRYTHAYMYEYVHMYGIGPNLVGCALLLSFSTRRSSTGKEGGCLEYTHTHTHTHLYIYIYIYIYQGEISLDELAAVMLNKKKLNGERSKLSEVGKQLFEMFDREGSGTISVSEVAETFSQLGKNWDMDEVHMFVSFLCVYVCMSVCFCILGVCGG